MGFDRAAGEATVTGRDAPDEAEALVRQLPEINDTNVCDPIAYIMCVTLLRMSCV